MPMSENERQEYAMEKAVRAVRKAIAGLQEAVALSPERAPADQGDMLKKRLEELLVWDQTHLKDN